MIVREFIQRFQRKIHFSSLKMKCVSYKFHIILCAFFIAKYYEKIEKHKRVGFREAIYVHQKKKYLIS